jgi:hypothetical protein
VLPRPTIEAFDTHLHGRGLRFEAVVIGGSALGLMGVIERPTRDLDILDPEVPPGIAEAAREFARLQRKAGVELLGRLDLLKSKLFALCDRGTDLPDCMALAPLAVELGECLPWLEKQDGNELWPDHVRATLADLGRRLGHGV